MRRRLFLILSVVVLTGCKLASVAYQEMNPEERTRKVQESLVALNYMSDAPDGVAGKNTVEAIKKFQQDSGMPVDGKVSQSVYIQSGLAASKSRRAKASVTRKMPPGLVAAGSTQDQPGGEQINRSCRYANWTGIVLNLADLFSCDQSRAIASLAAGRQVNFNVTSIAFQGGKLLAISQSRNSVGNAGAGAFNSKSKKDFSWDNWLDATQASIFRFVCVFPAIRAGDIKSGTTIQVNAKLESYSEESGVLICQ